MFFVGMMPPEVQEWLLNLGQYMPDFSQWRIVQWLLGLYDQYLAPLIGQLPLAEIGMTALLMFLAIGFMNDAANGRM